ncbi:MAG: hypothetical protein E7633_08620 [Ruminococcaceae bacterium]|nr:hypothetical protein [Oscillospiraceae bacterium]
MKNHIFVELIKQLSSHKSIKYLLFVSHNDLGEEIFSISAEFVGDASGESAIAEDICRDRKRAENFLYLIASEEVEPCHICDIVYDMLPL